MTRHGEIHDLLRRSDMHVQALFGDRLQTLTARRVADFAFEPNALGLESFAPLLEPANFRLLSDADDSPQYDDARYDDETDQNESEDAA